MNFISEISYIKNENIIKLYNEDIRCISFKIDIARIIIGLLAQLILDLMIFHINKEMNASISNRFIS